MKTIACTIILLALCATSIVFADTLTIGIRTYEGIFEGFDDNTFAFRADSGEMIRENRTNVRSLDIDNPVKVSYDLERGSKGRIVSTLKGYKGMKFIFETDGKEHAVFANHIKDVRIIRPPATQTAGQAPEGGGAIPRIDTAQVEQNPDLTDGQKAALIRYKAARDKYETFLRESSELVARMDQAQGKERTQIHNQLRMRKQEEQPVINALQAATTQLYNAFPSPEKNND